MDTMKILLGATIALLLGAVGLSWHGMRQGAKEASSDEVARLQKQMEELRIQQDRLQLEKQYRDIKTPEPAASPSVSESDRLRAELAAKEVELERIAEEKAKEEVDKLMAQDEEGLLGQRDLEKGDSELRRARLIGEALLMGRVTEFADSPDTGSFIVFEIIMPENVQQGSVLAIRRKTGIIGQIKVAEITPEGAIGNLLPGFGNFKPEAGDELILPPQ